MSYKEQSDKLAGPIGLLKQYVYPPPGPFAAIHTYSSFAFPSRRFITRTGRETAEDATQIFGGRGLTTTGMGKLVENVSPARPLIRPIISNSSLRFL